MLMKNTPRQLRNSENVPPTKGPSACPIADTPNTTPIARARERARHDRDRYREDERGADAMDHARNDEVELVGRGAADERHDAEDGEPDDDDHAAAEDVGEAARRHHERTDRQHVAAHDPLEVG